MRHQRRSRPDLLDRFQLRPRQSLTQANCYYEDSVECRGPERATGCYRGAIGEAAATITSAYMDVELATANWTDLQAKFDLRNQQCARIQEEITGNNDLMELADPWTTSAGRRILEVPSSPWASCSPA